MTPMPPKEKGNLWLGLSSVFFLLAVVSIFSPPSSPATGRRAWFHDTFFSLFGTWGEVVLLTVLGTVSILVAISNFRAAQKNRTNT